MCSAVALLPLLVVAETRPNIVVILVDDLGYHDLSCYGSTFYETPNLDKFATTAVRFTQGYAAHPVCSPTRASLLTGQNPARIGITDWIPGSGKKCKEAPPSRDLHQLPLEQVTIAETLKKAGYRTFFAGKWHLNHRGDEGFYPEDQGFEINKGGHHKGSPPGGYYAPYKNPKLKNGPDGEYLPDRLTDETIRFIEENPKQAFFAYLSFYTVHTPIQASKRHLEHFKTKKDQLEDAGPLAEREHDGWSKLRQDNAAYASMVHAMDENVGRLLAKLDELGLSDNTVVVFTSDNGGLSTLRRKGAPTSVRPLRGGKGWCYEGGIRVPWIIRAPGIGKMGSTCETPIYSADLYPTLLDLAKLPALPKQHRDGVSLAGLLRGKTDIDREFIVWHYPHYHGSAWRPGSAIRSGNWKLIEHYDYQKVELFDLSKDPGEKNDLSKDEPEKTSEMLEKLRGYLKEVGG